VLVLGLEVMGIGFGVLLLLLFDDCTCSYQTQRNLAHREIETLYSIRATTTSSTTAFSFCLTGIFSDYFRSDGLPKKLWKLLVNLFHRLYASPPHPPSSNQQCPSTSWQMALPYCGICAVSM